jgi:hypothetical protein
MSEIPDNSIDRNATGYELFPARKYVHVAAILSNEQRTARYSINRATGVWHWQKGWKIVGQRMPAEVAAYAQRVYDSLQPLHDDRTGKPCGYCTHCGYAGPGTEGSENCLHKTREV